MKFAVLVTCSFLCVFAYSDDGKATETQKPSSGDPFDIVWDPADSARNPPVSKVDKIGVYKELNQRTAEYYPRRRQLLSECKRLLEKGDLSAEEEWLLLSLFNLMAYYPGESAALLLADHIDYVPKKIEGPDPGVAPAGTNYPCVALLNKMGKHGSRACLKKITDEEAGNNSDLHSYVVEKVEGEKIAEFLLGPLPDRKGTRTQY